MMLKFVGRWLSIAILGSDCCFVCPSLLGGAFFYRKFIFMRCLTPYTVKNPKFATMPWLLSHIEVPCGRCPACRRRRAAAWSFRLLQREKLCHSSHFVTLTYDTDNVPVSDFGEMTLCPPPLARFLEEAALLLQGSKD